MKTQHKYQNVRFATRQRGVILILVVIGMLSMIGLAGLALDGGHTMVSKTRLQNVADAAALSAAKTLDVTGNDVTLATAEAYAMFADAANDSGNAEINAAYTSNSMTVTVEFSNTLVPFVPGTVPADYVRVTANNLEVPNSLMSAFGVDETIVSTSAVAGPSVSLGRICNVAPMMVCGDDAAGAPYYGFTPNEITVLKAGSANQTMVKGNFQLVRLGDNTGAADIRRAMAGDYDSCIDAPQGEDPTIIETEPGNTVGPVAQGLNTRFGIYQGPMGGSQSIYPPDVNDNVSAHDLETVDVDTDGDGQDDDFEVHYNGAEVTYAADGTPNISYHYDTYDNDNSHEWPAPVGKEGRRVIAIPVGDCGGEQGQSQLEYLTTLCYFLLQDVAQGPDPDVFGQFIPDGCPVTGNAGPTPTTGPGPYVIQLYKDSTRVES